MERMPDERSPLLAGFSWFVEGLAVFVFFRQAVDPFSPVKLVAGGIPRVLPSI
jgi:hypothetical protein